jgi:cobalt-zinc-cadmium efflux system protein
LTAWLFLKDKEKDLNIKGAYLHMLTDTMVSVGVVLSGIIILLTDLYWVDTVMTWIIVGMIILSTWSLFKDSIRLGLDGVPNGIDIGKIQLKILKIEDVVSVHHIHIWGLSTTENAMTGHLVLATSCTFEDAAKIKNKIKHLLEHENIQHVTLEIEKENEHCVAHDCNIVHEKENHHCDHHH